MERGRGLARCRGEDMWELKNNREGRYAVGEGVGEGSKKIWVLMAESAYLITRREVQECRTLGGGGTPAWL